ncbi:MAG: NUDIX domain-containing protein [Rickettsiales bacterium]|jgi:isopentenyldiphosphate isomerase|nr:NUDIX domain-containing protein [Rickettsiales bacterium]
MAEFQGSFWKPEKQVKVEYLDVLDENGLKTGEMIDRKLVHQKGLWHRALCVAAVKFDRVDGWKVLMQRRALNKDKFPGMWDLTLAAHVVAKEFSVTSAAREFKEEVNFILPFKVSLSDFMPLFSFRDMREIPNKDGTVMIENQHYDFFIMNKKIDMGKIEFNDGEVMDIGWKTYDDIKEFYEQDILHPRTQWVDPLFEFLATGFLQ